MNPFRNTKALNFANLTCNVLGKIPKMSNNLVKWDVLTFELPFNLCVAFFEKEKLLDWYYKPDMAIIQSRKHFASSFLFFLGRFFSYLCSPGWCSFSFSIVFCLCQTACFFISGMEWENTLVLLILKKEEGSRSCLIHIWCYNKCSWLNALGTTTPTFSEGP